MNNGSIIGRLVRDIEISYTKDSKAIAKSSIAVNDKFKKDYTHFFDFVSFGKTAETMKQYLKKGSQVGLAYELKQDRWQSKEGQNKSRIVLSVQSFTFCGKKENSPSGNNNKVGPEDIARDPDFDFEPNDDEIPF
jgi:single-strand DNA-binding protein